MSATSYNPNDENVRPIRMTGKPDPRSAEPEAVNFRGSQPLSQSRPHGGYRGGHAEVSDEDLIDGAQCGDQQAFVELCKRHTSIVKYKILRIVRNQEDAEDALQDTLLRAYTHMPSFRGSCRFSTWLTAIGVNSALMILRRRGVRKETYASTGGGDTDSLDQRELVDLSPGPESIYLKRETILLVRREIEKLQPSLRFVVNRYYGSDCSLEEAAKAQEITVSAAKSRLMRGRVRLRSSLGEYRIFKSRMGVDGRPR
jgi:RNA polymerase sigma-70 factor (ECF subfamily)